ncbi:MAG TPA: hypothetical protein VF961_05590, partial [Pyrinomonadaceae bacterium]
MPDDPKTDDTIQSESKPNSSEESVSSGASASPKSADETREVKRDYEVSSRPAGVAAPVNLPLTARDLGAPQVLTPAAQTIEGTGSPVTEGDSGNRQHRADSSGSSEREPQAKPFTAAIGVLFYVVVGIAIASINVKARTFIFSRWRWFAGLVLAIGLISGILATRQWFKRATAQRRIGLIIFGVIPLVMISVGTVILLPVAFRAAALRMIFLLCVCLLPATMYYLFIATKK